VTGRFLLLFLALTLAAPQALSQQYPARAVRIIVASSPGSGVDIVSRIMAQKLSAGLGQQVVVDNRAGAGANLGAEIAARSPADGYTLLMGTPAHVINVSLYSGLSYDVIRDFAPVSLVSTGQYVVIVHPSVPARSAKQLIVLGKANPGALAFGSAGPATRPISRASCSTAWPGSRCCTCRTRGAGPPW
jgi:tripartite-type tricarboxylate transporter receptor subunit TctC